MKANCKNTRVYENGLSQFFYIDVILLQYIKNILTQPRFIERQHKTSAGFVWTIFKSNESLKYEWAGSSQYTEQASKHIFFCYIDFYLFTLVFSYCRARAWNFSQKEGREQKIYSKNVYLIAQRSPRNPLNKCILLSLHILSPIYFRLFIRPLTIMCLRIFFPQNIVHL